MRFSLFESGCLTCLAAIVIVLCLSGITEGRDLCAVLAQVEQHTPALKAARAETAVRQAAVRRAKSRYFGEVDAMVKNSNYDSDRLINPMSYPPDLKSKLFDDNQFSYGITVRVPLDINGSITAMVDAAEKRMEAARIHQGDIRLALLHGAASLYHSLEGVKAVEEALQKQVQALTAHIKVATASIKAGRIPLVEKLRIVADKEAVKGKLASLYGKEQGIRAKLAALMGTDSFSDIVTPVHDLPANTVEPVDDIMNRPDIRALRFQTSAADADVKATLSQRFPELNINGFWLQNQGFNGEEGDTWALFIDVKLPLWDGGSRRSAVSGAEAGLRAVRYHLTALQNQARAEFAAAKADASAAKASYTATIASVKAARATERIQSDRFAKGRVSAADLVDAEAALAGARSDRALALTYWWQAEDRIRHAVGLIPIAYKGHDAMSQSKR